MLPSDALVICFTYQPIYLYYVSYIFNFSHISIEMKAFRSYSVFDLKAGEGMTMFIFAHV